MTIITPVHISTGEEKRAFEYKQNCDQINCYLPSDLFAQIPANVLLDRRFLSLLSNPSQNESVRDTLNQQIKDNVDYDRIEPIYQLECHLDEIEGKNVSVQMKSLNNPIIPGSSIKGALMTMILYDWSLKHLEELYRYSGNGKNFTVDTIMKNYYNDSSFGDFIKLFRSCFMCQDVPFDDMIYMSVQRNHVDISKDGNTPPLADVECIKFNQSYTGNIVSINKDKANRVFKRFEGKPFVNDFKAYLDTKKLISIGSKYFKDMISEELDTEAKAEYYDSKGVYDVLNKLKDDRIKNGFYMRVGRHTNYFFKTISYAIKKNNPQFYIEHFNDYFSPKRKPEHAKKNVAYPVAEKMPSTRSLYYDGNDTYYPGVIKLEFVNED